MVCVHTYPCLSVHILNLYSFLLFFYPLCFPPSFPPLSLVPISSIFSSSSSFSFSSSFPPLLPFLLPPFLPPPSFPQIIYILITLAMEEHDTHRELASVLISDLYSHTVNSRDIANSKYHVACYELQTECLHFTLLTWSRVYITWVSPLLPTPHEKVFTRGQLQDACSELGQGLTWFLTRC